MFPSGKVTLQHTRSPGVDAVPVEHQRGTLGEIRNESRQSSDSLGDLISRLNRVLARNPLQDCDGSVGTAPPEYETM